MKVLDLNGSKHQEVGLLPVMYVSKNIDGIKLGKDEFLEKAIGVILNREE